MNKILFYIDTMYKGGAQRVMNNLLEHYAQDGYSVVLVNDFIQDEHVSQYSVNSKVKRVYIMKRNSGNRYTKNFKRLFLLRKIVKNEKPDILISFLGRPNVRMILSTLGLKIKKYVSVRNDPEREYGSSRLKKKYVGMLFRFVDGCVFQTEEAQEYFPISVQNKSQIILNPVNKLFFKVKRSDLECKDIITVGRLEDQKNHKMLIDAFSIIANETVDNLIIYGEGPLREALNNYINEKHLEKRVFLPGETSAIEQKYSKAKIFVLSSNYEGLPNALMEALAVGVPCISTDCPCGGPKILIKDGVNGFLTPCNDSHYLARKIKELLDNKHIRESFSFEARKNAQAFNTDEILRVWDSFIMK